MQRLFQYAKKLLHKGFDALSIHLFIILLSLPIFVAWGIPISLMSFIGNTIFTPLLAVYIFLSSLLFLAALFNTKLVIIASALNLLTYWWLQILNTLSIDSYIGFTSQSFLLTCIISMATLLITHTKKINTQQKGLLYILLFSITLSCQQVCRKTKESIIKIPCFDKHLYLLTYENNYIIIDTGALGKKSSAPSYLQYTLIPEVIKSTGLTKISTFITLQPTSFTFAALEVACQKNWVKTIYVPIWHGKAPRSWYRNWCSCKKAARESNCAIVRIKQNKKYLINKKNRVILEAQKKTYKNTKNYFLTNTHIYGAIDNNLFNFYASKYKKSEYTSI